MRRGWREASMTFALGVGDSPHINIMMGRCVGGSSLMTGGVCFRTPTKCCTSGWMATASPTCPQAACGPSSKVERRSHVETVPDSLRSRSTTLFMQGPSAWATMSANQRNTEDCCGCSRCNFFGCPHGAKLSVDLTYLPRAIAAGAKGAVGLPRRRASVRWRAGDEVRGRVLEQDGAIGIRRRAFSVRARRVVLAAAIHTAKLLLDSGLGPVCRRWDAISRCIPACGSWLASTSASMAGTAPAERAQPGLLPRAPALDEHLSAGRGAGGLATRDWARTPRAPSLRPTWRCSAAWCTTMGAGPRQPLAAWPAGAAAQS